MAAGKGSASSRILHNSFWYGLETLLETVVFLGTSIAVARYFGPKQLGIFSYINFFVTVVTRTSGVALADATRKYMSEFLALDRPGIARSVYHLAYRYQLLGSIVLTAVGLVGIAFFGEPGYRLMSVLLVLSIVPGIMSWVPANANQAFEDMSQNTFSAFGFLVAYTIVIVLTLHLHWGLVGIAAASLISRTVELILRTIPLHRRLRAMPLEPVDAALKDRIRSFCLQSIGIQLLVSIVWDRSELIFLRYFSTFEQVAFYSVSFGLANNLLVIPRTFGGATGITLMVEASRAPENIRSIVSTSTRFLLLVVFPVHLGAAAITRLAIGYTYGPRYVGAIPVLIVAAILAIPRAFQQTPEVLLRAADRQRRLFFWMAITGAVNITLDALLIPRFGAVGAAWGNGLSQGFGIAAIWVEAQRYFPFEFPRAAALRLALAGTLMAAAAWEVTRLVPNLFGLILAVVSAVPVYIVLVKLCHGLEPADGLRMAPMANRLPGRARELMQRSLTWVAGPAPALKAAGE